MIIGDRLRALREEKKFSQGDIEKRTGLLRCYISRVENGHTVPAIETLEKMARALEVPLYQLFYDGEEPPELPNLPKRKTGGENDWGRIAASTTAELQLAVSVLAPDRAGPKLWEKGQPGAAMPRSSFPTRFGGFVALRSRVALLAPAHSVLSDGASNRAGAVAGVSVDLPPDAA